MLGDHRYLHPFPTRRSSCLSTDPDRRHPVLEATGCFFMSHPETYDLFIIGAGPAGLACAIEARNAGMSYLVADKGGIVEDRKSTRLNSRHVRISSADICLIT